MYTASFGELQEQLVKTDLSFILENLKIFLVASEQKRDSLKRRRLENIVEPISERKSAKIASHQFEHLHHSHFLILNIDVRKLTMRLPLFSHRETTVTHTL